MMKKGSNRLYKKLEHSDADNNIGRRKITT